jgi:hypothetical protein
MRLIFAPFSPGFTLGFVFIGARPEGAPEWVRVGGQRKRSAALLNSTTFMVHFN